MHLADSLASICARYGVDALYAFGSRGEEVRRAVAENASLDPENRSDVDFGALPAPGRIWTAEERARLTIELEDALGVGRVDLIVLPEADPFLAVDVLRGELVYCRDPDREAEYELFVLRRAGDLAPFERERIERLLGRGER